MQRMCEPDIQSRRHSGYLTVYSLATATLDGTHRWKYGERWIRHVFGGGRCGGAAPAQGRAEGPTAQKTENEERANTFTRLIQVRESIVAE